VDDFVFVFSASFTFDLTAGGGAAAFFFAGAAFFVVDFAIASFPFIMAINR
jgi:hypothetical protein